MNPGTIQKLNVVRKIDTGYVLDNDVLLHNKETETELEPDQQVEVFLYTDKKGLTVATTTIPHITMDTYDWAEVVEVVPELGVFVNIGIAKEMLVSVDDLPLYKSVWPQIGDMLYVTLGRDRKGRLLALPASEGVVRRQWEQAPEDLMNKPFSGRVYHTSKEGTAIISEDGYRGFIHRSERMEEPRLGQWIENGRVIDVKEDGTVNVSLRPLKQHSMGEDADTILLHLEQNDGVIPFSDKSDPEDIRGTFNISKAAFKRALGKLMKERRVEQRDGKTYLL